MINFLLVVFEDAKKVFEALLEGGIVVRNMEKQIANSLRFTIGRREENDRVIATVLACNR